MATPPDPPRSRADYESTPLTRAEYIAALVHLYRGELYRANTWRMRLDNTTNWAILTTAGLLTFSFGPVEHSHWVLLIGMALIVVFHAIEARRFRFADVWRARVRMIEENFYGPILRRDPVSPDENWGRLVAEDLFRPRFKISRLESMRRRLSRNYWPIYTLLVISWIGQVLIKPVPVHTWDEVRERLGTGLIPWWLPILYVFLFLSALLVLVCVTPRTPSSEAEYWQLDKPPEDDKMTFEF